MEFYCHSSLKFGKIAFSVNAHFGKCINYKKRDWIMLVNLFLNINHRIKDELKLHRFFKAVLYMNKVELKSSIMRIYQEHLQKLTDLM